jgi:hypothetical protein
MDLTAAVGLVAMDLTTLGMAGMDLTAAVGLAAGTKLNITTPFIHFLFFKHER